MKLPSVRDLTVATRQVATKSALNPIQWICALTTPAAIVASCATSPPLSYILIAIGSAPVLYGIRAYDHFMKRDPDRLQSERYLIERQVVGRIGINGPEGSEIVIQGDEVGVERPIEIGDGRDG